MRTTVFVLKVNPKPDSQPMQYESNYSWYTQSDDVGPPLYDPRWSMQWATDKGTHLRFTGMWTHNGIGQFMEVFCDDALCPELYGSQMVWKVSKCCRELICYWRQPPSSYSFRHESAVTYEESGKHLLIIRLRFYWVMRGIVGFKRLIARIRIRRRAQRKLFIRATYWGNPECKLSRFAGTINTQVKQRIHAFI
jgi:hypothetical protein